MTRLSALSAVAALAIGTAALPVLAQTVAQTAPAPAAPTRALSAIIQDFETRGYRVLEVDVKRAWIEVEAINPAGQRIEADVDPVTGQTVREKPDT
jgi:hypothetical protein